MIDPKSIDEIAERFLRALPDDLSRLSDEVNGALRKTITATLAKSDLVTREEFDVQSAVLARSREKLEALEEKVEALEKQLAEKTQ